MLDPLQGGQETIQKQTSLTVNLMPILVIHLGGESQEFLCDFNGQENGQKNYC